MRPYHTRAEPGDLLSGPHLVTVTDEPLPLSELFYALDEDWGDVEEYDEGDIANPLTRTGLKYKCIVAGTSGASEPAWPTAVGQTVVDGTATWECVATRCVQPELKLLALIPAGEIHWAEGVATEDSGVLPLGGVSLGITPKSLDRVTFVSADAVDLQVIQES